MNTDSSGLTGQAGAICERLLDIANSLGADVDTQSVFHSVMEAALSCVGGAACLLHLVTGDNRAGRSRAGGPCGDLLTGELAGPARSALEQVAHATAHSRRIQSVALKLGLETRRALAVPVTVNSTAVGALCVVTEPGGELSPSDEDYMRLLAAQVGIAIHNDRLREIAQRRSEHMELVAHQAWQEEARARTVLEIAAAVTEKTNLDNILADVTRSACAEIGFERSRIYLADPDQHSLEARLEARAGTDPEPVTGEMVPLRRDGDCPLSKAALSAEPYQLDTVHDPEGGAAVTYQRLYMPLVTQGRLVGLMVADNPVSGSAVSPRQARLLHSLSCLAGVAIERARVDRLRATLISSVSHELRAPLASIRAYNELVMTGDAGEVNEEQTMFLGRVEYACRRLEGVIDDLMNLSKLRAGEIAISPAVTDLPTLIRAVMDTLAPRANAAGVKVEFEQAESVPAITTDPARLEQVLTNLVDNAIKFNEAGGWVRVELSGAQGEVVIAVRDDGPGIPASHHALIFEEFQHGTDERTRAREGAGLGLAIASRVVRFLGGRLWLESDVGEGSTFYVALPVDPSHEADDASVAAEVETS